MALLQVKGITKVYGSDRARVTALEDVSFELESGRMLAVLGPSGSGKTTLISIVAGLLAPTSGAIVVEGRGIHLHGPKEAAAYRRKTIGIVFQDYHLVPYLSALDNLLLIPHLGGRVTRAHHEQALALLDEMGLADRARHVPAELSGGERQRVAIARALMNDPAIMLVDEPTANLDTARGEQVVELLHAHVAGRHMSCVMVTHDPRMAARADTTLSLLDGRVQV
jgi:putative ABC transport system ATP-binding protein